MRAEDRTKLIEVFRELVEGLEVLAHQQVRDQDRLNRATAALVGDDSPERALLRRILRESGAEVFAEPGGQPAWLSGSSVNLPVSREEIALVEEVLR